MKLLYHHNYSFGDILYSKNQILASPPLTLVENITVLETLGPGTAAAVRRRNNALYLERRWAELRRAHALSVEQGRTILRRGHFKLDELKIPANF